MPGPIRLIDANIFSQHKDGKRMINYTRLNDVEECGD